jgi:hypothetical protein
MHPQVPTAKPKTVEELYKLFNVFCTEDPNAGRLNRVYTTDLYDYCNKAPHALFRIPQWQLRIYLDNEIRNSEGRKMLLILKKGKREIYWNPIYEKA